MYPLYVDIMRVPVAFNTTREVKKRTEIDSCQLEKAR